MPVVTGPQGRTLEVTLGGPGDGRAVIFHNGTPGAGTLFDPMVQEGASRGLRHVAYSRPGYGGSDRHAGRAVGDCVTDVTAIADQLGIDRFFVVGQSGGGPHALACAALLGERVIAAASVAGVAPRDAHGLDWLAGMGHENVEEFDAAAADADGLLAYLRQHGDALMNASPAELHAALGDLVSDVDRQALTAEFAEFLADQVRVGLKPGLWGWFDDDLAFMRDWGFDLGVIERPVTIWQGEQDRFVPFAHGEWLAGNVAGATAKLRPQDGHLSLLVGSYDEILDDLLAAE